MIPSDSTTCGGNARVSSAPIPSLKDRPNGVDRDAVLFGQATGRYAPGNVTRSNLLDLDSGQFCPRVIGASWMRRRGIATLHAHVGVVVGECSDEEMIAVAARRVIAMMEHRKSSRHRPVLQNPREAMSENRFTRRKTKTTVTLRVAMALVLDATIRHLKQPAVRIVPLVFPCCRCDSSKPARTAGVRPLSPTIPVSSPNNPRSIDLFARGC